MWRIWTWLHPTQPAPGTCPWCEHKLQVCSTCLGDWQRGCRECSGGLSCPAHEAFWIL